MPSQKNQPQSPKLTPDAQLEAKALAAGATPMHPLVSKITHRLGSLNVIRNARNEKTDELSKITDAM